MKHQLTHPLLAALLGVVFTAEIHAQTSAFTYQGRLSENGAAASGSYDLVFSLHDASAGGSQVGSLVTNSAVAVNDGLFNVLLDFGANVFTNEGRWLQIAVRVSGGGGVFTPLSPRQALTAVPMAQYALTPAGPRGPEGPQGPAGPQGARGPEGPAGASPFTLAGTNAFFLGGNVGIGTNDPVTTLHVAGNVRAEGFDGPISASQLTGTIAPVNIATGSISGEMVALQSITASHLAPAVGVWKRVGSDIHYPEGKVGIGTEAPAQDLEIAAGGDGEAGLTLTVPHVFVDPFSRQRPAGGAGVIANGPLWLNPEYALVGDGLYATCQLNGDALKSGELIVTNFGFRVPAEATVRGVEVTCRVGIDDNHDFADAGRMDVRLAPGSAVRTFTGGCSERDIVLGSSSDGWGLALTPAAVNAPDFGVRVQCQSGSKVWPATASYRISMNLVLVTVHYTTSRNGLASYTVGSTASTGDLQFAAGQDLSAPGMTLTRDGRLGVGTTTPSSPLEVNGTVTATLFVGSGAELAASAGGPVLMVSNASPSGVAVEAATATLESGKGAVVGRAAGRSGSLMNSVAGVLGDSETGRGVIGVSKTNDGVLGWSTSRRGVVGNSIDGEGVYGWSQNGAAVYAQGRLHATGDMTAGGTVTADKLAYNSPRTNYLSLPPAAFVPWVSDSTANLVRGAYGNGLYFTGGTWCAAVAPVRLPQGATVTRVTMYYVDNDTTYSCRVGLLRWKLSASENIEMASMESGGALSSRRSYMDASITSPVVDNKQFVYEVYADAGTALSAWGNAGTKVQLHGVIIEYIISEAE